LDAAAWRGWILQRAAFCIFDFCSHLLIRKQVTIGVISLWHINQLITAYNNLAVPKRQKNTECTIPSQFYAFIQKNRQVLK
jgi:hypothetical protein